jgi:alpha-tubulin suppressor-like RCC1 family protein
MGYNANTKRFINNWVFMIPILAAGITAALTLISIVSASTAHAQSSGAAVSHLSTGYDSACVVIGGTAKCWGSNEAGKLGNGTDIGAIKSTPVTVANNKNAIPAGPTVCQSSFFGVCTSSGPSTPAVPASPIGGKYVEKVSVGRSHACALAAARIYCWGDNSHGQLGNHSTTSSAIPVPVAINEAVAAGPTVCRSSFFGICTSSGPSTPAQPASALRQKEVIDISAGEYFTCALSSDGSVACWGEGDNGRLGTNATADTNYPVSVYMGGALSGKRGVKLAKAAGGTMCVLAVNSGSTVTTASGTPYCWGYGIDDGRAIPGNGSSTVACNKNSPRTRPSGTTTNTVIFESKQPVQIPSETFANLDGDDYITGQGTNNRAYYWGMYGYTETVTYANITSCNVNPCTGMSAPGAKIILAATTTKKTTKGTGGSYSSTQRHPSGSYSGKATPNTHAGGGAQTGGGGSSCTAQTHYGYTKNSAFAPTGQKVATTPPAWPQSQAGISAVSGNVYNGLFCAATTAGPRCDAHGTSMNEGQTGSGYTAQCTTSGGFLGLFPTTTCEPGPSGPQAVVSNGWLAGKSVGALSTGTTGFTCALANASVGCWGINNKGQLGTGDTTNRNVPTAVNL